MYEFEITNCKTHRRVKAEHSGNAARLMTCANRAVAALGSYKVADGDDIHLPEAFYLADHKLWTVHLWLDLADGRRVKVWVALASKAAVNKFIATTWRREAI